MRREAKVLNTETRNEQLSKWIAAWYLGWYAKR